MQFTTTTSPIGSHVFTAYTDDAKRTERNVFVTSIRRVVYNLQTADAQQTQAYFVDILGFEVAMDLGWIVTLVSPDNPTAQVSILMHDPSELHPDLSVEVDDVDAVYAKAIANKAEIVYRLTDEPWGVRRFFMREPSGRIVNIVSHAEHS
jgi:catechol 2,3-dioxygenase-like lactoylglutathione lyase family enzyme